MLHSGRRACPSEWLTNFGSLTPNMHEDLFAEFSPATRREWLELAATELGTEDVTGKLVWKTLEGFEVRPIYDADDLRDVAHEAGLPGIPPFGRDTRALGNALESWIIAQDVSHPDPRRCIGSPPALRTEKGARPCSHSLGCWLV